MELFIFISSSFWSISLLLGENNYEYTKIFLQSFFGKFLIIGFCWTFSFHVLNEIRHLAWDLGYGFELKVSKITGILSMVGSFFLTVVVYLLGKEIF